MDSVAHAERAVQEIALRVQNYNLLTEHPLRFVGARMGDVVVIGILAPNGTTLETTDVHTADHWLRGYIQAQAHLLHGSLDDEGVE